jgi:hypothetical protein
MELKIYDRPGLYIIGQTSFNPFTNKKYYLIKVGMTSNSLVKRLRDYYTHNPSLWIIETIPVRGKVETILKKEKEFQEILSFLSMKKDVNILENDAYFKNKEWFCVSENDYKEICEKGQKYLKNCLTNINPYDIIIPEQKKKKERNKK